VTWSFSGQVTLLKTVFLKPLLELTMKTQMKMIAAGLLLAGSSLAQAAVVGDVTGGGTFTGTVATGDGWSTNNGVGVDFWTITVGDNTDLSVDISGAFSYGISIYEGAVQSDAMGSFDNNADYSYNFFADQATYVTGTPEFFGPFDSLYVTLADAGTYTIALGGVDGLFQSMDYSMDVSAVPLPAAFWLFGSALLGMFGYTRRRA
jgi:hypothetical protein